MRVVCSAAAEFIAHDLCALRPKMPLIAVMYHTPSKSNSLSSRHFLDIYAENLFRCARILPGALAVLQMTCEIGAEL